MLGICAGRGRGKGNDDSIKLAGEKLNLMLNCGINSRGEEAGRNRGSCEN